ncbi:hypothetical protein [Roseateles sp.]|uniref:hypothetical protein n=1 Tax=Roseateles sp. TaxID=1971397 RepID=UPI00286B75A9|nr:hypothetical protein [Roseateles sp.]
MRSRTRLLRKRQLWLENKVRERTAELEASSLTAPLTGLRNRRFLALQIESDVALSLRRLEAPRQGDRPTDAYLIFFLLDIDHLWRRVLDRRARAPTDGRLLGQR